MCLFLGAAAGAAAGAASTGLSAGIGTIMGVAQMGLGIMAAQQQHAAAMQQYQEQVRFRQEQQVQAQKTLNQQVSQQQAAYTSEIGKAQGEKATAAMDAYAAESRAAAAAAESGVVGMSVQNMIADVRGDAGRFMNTIDYNAEMATWNTKNELKMAQRGAQARVAEIPIPTKPSFGPAAVQMGSAIVSGLGTMMKYSGSSTGSTYSPWTTTMSYG